MKTPEKQFSVFDVNRNGLVETDDFFTIAATTIIVILMIASALAPIVSEVRKAARHD